MATECTALSSLAASTPTRAAHCNSLGSSGGVSPGQGNGHPHVACQRRRLGGDRRATQHTVLASLAASTPMRAAHCKSYGREDGA